MKYPIGIQSFDQLIEGGYVYVDKTDLVYSLATEGKIYFLSRPRRFGKSLLLSTVKNYFLGRKELFKGLKIYSLEKDGFSADRTFSVTVVEEVPALVSDYYTLEKAETAFVGAEYELPQVTVYGGTGRTSCLIEVYDGDGAILEHNGESIVFPEPGIYTIRHTIRDYIDARSYEYSVNVTLNGDPLCNEDAFFPRFFSDGFEYELQPLTAKLYAEDGTFSEKETKIYCRYGGTETPVENNIFVPHVHENGDTVTIVYKAARADGSLAEVKSYEVPVLKVCSEGKIDAAANFAANGLSVTASEDGVVLQTDGLSGVASRLGFGRLRLCCFWCSVSALLSTKSATADL